MSQQKQLSENNCVLSTQDIIKIIPHRYPFLMIDKVIKLELGQEIIGIKNVTANEPQFIGHFPNNPVMPGVLTIESMAQLSAILVAKTIKFDTNSKIFYLITIEKVKFRKIITSGDTMVITSKISQAYNKRIWKFNAEVKIDGTNNLAAEGIFTGSIKDLLKPNSKIN